MSDYELRFGGVARLVGAAGLARLRRAHVGVVGVGGVGSWAVEALARSGVGRLTLVDLDDVCVSNANRQLPALEGEFGRPKVEVLARRARAINPECVVHPVAAFFSAANAAQVLETRFDYVLDAIDSLSMKCLLIASCRERGLPILTSGAAGGRRDPTALRVTDLAQASHDQLLRAVRTELRANFGFPRGQNLFGVECVHSVEATVYPRLDGTVCARKEAGAASRLDCDSGLGTACFVTGAFGLVAAGWMVRRMAEE